MQKKQKLKQANTTVFAPSSPIIIFPSLPSRRGRIFSLSYSILLYPLSHPGPRRFRPPSRNPSVSFSAPLLMFYQFSVFTTAHLIVSSSFRPFICPYYFSLLSCILSFNSLTLVPCRISSFLILSLCVTPLIVLRHLLPAAISFFTCCSLKAHVSALYKLIGQIIVPYTWLYSLIGIPNVLHTCLYFPF